MTRKRLNLCFLALATLGAIANLSCGKAGSATAKIQLAKATLQRGDIPVGGTAVVPTVFEMKLLSAYLVEDVDATTQNNVGQVARIWVNPGCPSDNSCTPADVDYFNLIDPTAANTALNSQGRTIDIAAGAANSKAVFRYVRIEFCVGSANSNNVKFKTAGMVAATEVTYGGCGETSAALEAPLELGNGQSALIALDYDLSVGPIYTGPGGGSCTASAPCLSGITLKPRIIR